MQESVEQVLRVAEGRRTFGERAEHSQVRERAKGLIGRFRSGGIGTASRRRTWRATPTRSLRPECRLQRRPSSCARFTSTVCALKRRSDGSIQRATHTKNKSPLALGWSSSPRRSAADKSPPSSPTRCATTNGETGKLSI